MNSDASYGEKSGDAGESYEGACGGVGDAEGVECLTLDGAVGGPSVCGTKLEPGRRDTPLNAT